MCHLSKCSVGCMYVPLLSILSYPLSARVVLLLSSCLQLGHAFCPHAFFIPHLFTHEDYGFHVGIARVKVLNMQSYTTEQG
jgi:hypothetical protein